MPQLKQPITSIDQMTCENCIYYQKPSFKEESCINPDSDNWYQEKEDCCSHGEWLYFGKWFGDEAKEQLHVMSYSELYCRFAELAS